MKVIKLEKGKKEGGCVESAKVGETGAGKALRATPSAPFALNQKADISICYKSSPLPSGDHKGLPYRGFSCPFVSRRLMNVSKEFKEKYLWEVWKEAKRDIQEDVKEGKMSIIT